MRKYLKLIAVVLILTSFLLIFAGFGDKKENEIAWAEMPVNQNPNLKYFGYYHFSENIDEVTAMGNANVAKVDASEIEEIAHYYRNGIKILIMIRDIFFEHDATPVDWEARWIKAKADIAPYMDLIIGFYVDEPIWTGKSQEAFHLASQTVRADFPEKRMMAMMAYSSIVTRVSVEEAAEYFKYCTDLGFDIYQSWDAEDFQALVDNVEDNVAIYGQDIWLSPKGFYVSKPTHIYYMFENRKLPPGEDIKNWIKGVYCVAAVDTRVVGLFTFCYGSSSTAENYDIYLDIIFDETNEHYDEYTKKLYMQIGKACIKNDV